MSQKRQVSEREWLATVAIAAVLLPAEFVYLWHAFDSWSQALAITYLTAEMTWAKWRRRHAAPDRNVFRR